MIQRTAVVAVCAALLAATASADAVWLTNNLTLSLQQSTPASGIKPHKNVIQFLGAALVDLEDIQTSDGVMNNPLYHDEGRSGNNPLYEAKRPSPGDQLEASNIGSISFELSTPTFHLHSQGVIHRDLAARNLLLRTAQGDYSSGPLDSLSFGSDGPLDLRTVDPKIPVRWSAPEVLRLYYNGDTNSDTWIDVEAESLLETAPVPTPGAIGLLSAAGLLGMRRRR